MSNIPPKFEEKLLNLINEMENETGELYEINVMKFNSNTNGQKIGEIRKRQMKIKVYDMTEEYDELNGIYDNYEVIEDKIRKMKYYEIYEELKTIDFRGKEQLIGKCKKCHKYNDDTNYDRKCPNVVELLICQTPNCNKYMGLKWQCVIVSTQNNEIYKSGGGRYAECVRIGKYQFINIKN